jgi:hypothetical protein
VTVITVTAGKPSELGFKLSKSSLVPAGTVLQVTIRKITRLRICTRPVTARR